MKKIILILIGLLVVSGCSSKDTKVKFLNQASIYSEMMYEYIGHPSGVEYSIKKFKELREDVRSMDVPTGYEKGDEIKKAMLDTIERNLNYCIRQKNKKQSDRTADELLGLMHQLSESNKKQQVLQDILDELRRIKAE